MNDAELFFAGNDVSSSTNPNPGMAGWLPGSASYNPPAAGDAFDFSNPAFNFNDPAFASSTAAYVPPDQQQPTADELAQFNTGDVPLSHDQAQQAAATLAVNTAAAGGTVSPEVVAMWQAQGLNIGALTTVAGAVMSLVKQANGAFAAQPVNTQAHAAVAQASQTKTYVIAAAAGLALFLLLRNKGR